MGKIGGKRPDLAARNRTHGESHKNPEWYSWRGMKARCRNPNEPCYPNYGGRGITYCERWERYENFLADMGRKPGKGYTLDRIDNNGPYEPSNCRWATWQEQNNNRRRRSKETKPRRKRGWRTALLVTGLCLLPFTAKAGDDDGSYAGPIFYATTISGYDYKSDQVYTRMVYIWVMPPDSLHPENGPPPPKMLRSFTVNLTIQAVPAEDGALCDPQAPVVYEHGEETFLGCLHGIPMPPQVIQ